MLNDLKRQLEELFQSALKNAYPHIKDFPPIELDFPTDKSHGDLSTNIALKSVKLFKQSPLAIAGDMIKLFQAALADSSLAGKVSKIEAKAPGFINFFLSAQCVHAILNQVFKQGDRFGQSKFGQMKKVQIEFVSANPTGPLSIAHARQAAVGDALGNILTCLGFAVAKEYYVNDGGNQITLLGESIKCRCYESFGDKREIPAEGYQGEYIKDMAQEFLTKKKIKDVKSLEKIDNVEFKQFGCDYLLAVIRKELDDFGVHFDQWSYETKIATKAKIEEMLDYLGEKGFLYEKDGALWFKSTDFGDDKDRVVKKSDGTYTYLTPDIVYHRNKFDRGFEKLINIWGPDHHGYIPRIKAAVAALGKDKEALSVLIVQLATVYRNGAAISMSTRKGQYISLREVMDEVGVDASRYFFLMRNINAHLDFDLEIAKKETAENPVYYIQYAHARVHSLNSKAKESGLAQAADDFSRLDGPPELELIKKLGNFPDFLRYCYEQLDPYPLVSYLHELALLFHKYYDSHRVIDNDKELSAQRLALMNASRIVFAVGLKLLGVNAPQKM